ncbi:sensor histidine kinase [Sphingobacterium siyangense]|uniref:sensor histidine kinase n=1 Tax=Sphingobacterium siyangense TaxID=459529 RepID=UPI002FDD69F7
MENKVELTIFFWLGTAIMLASVLGVIFIILLHRNKVFRIKKQESENLLKNCLEVEKRERKRIALDLHDGISGDLNAMRNYLTVIQHGGTDEQKKSLLKEIETIVDSTLDNIQNISYNLMPPMLESQGLVPTLQSYFERTIKLNAISISDHYHTEAIEIPPAESYELYRIIQELVANAIKHGKASEIYFNLEKFDKEFVIEIVDNGKRYDFFKELRESQGMGLKNITSRISQMKGKLVQTCNSDKNRIQIYYYDKVSRSR